MATTNPTRQEGTDPRPHSIILGEDTEGAHHVYETRRERVIVIQDSTVTHVEALDGRPVEHWMDYVRCKRGWRSQRLHTNPADAWSACLQPLADSLDKDA